MVAEAVASEGAAVAASTAVAAVFAAEASMAEDSAAAALPFMAAGCEWVAAVLFTHDRMFPVHLPGRATGEAGPTPFIIETFSAARDLVPNAPLRPAM